MGVRPARISRDGREGFDATRMALRANAQLGDGNYERDTETNPADDPSKAVGESDTHVVADENGP
jgi:hypothetical protein